MRDALEMLSIGGAAAPYSPMRSDEFKSAGLLSVTPCGSPWFSVKMTDKIFEPSPTPPTRSDEFAL